MAHPRSIRFDDDVERRLASFVERRPGLSRSAVAARLVDEGLRMHEHPGILFRDGPTGRRATVVGGPDVWQVVHAVRAARGNEPGLDEAALLDLVTQFSGATFATVRTALDYWSAYPAEVDSMVDHQERVEAAMLTGAERRLGLLGP